MFPLLLVAFLFYDFCVDYRSAEFDVLVVNVVRLIGCVRFVGQTVRGRSAAACVVR